MHEWSWDRWSQDVWSGVLTGWHGVCLIAWLLPLLAGSPAWAQAGAIAANSANLTSALGAASPTGGETLPPSIPVRRDAVADQTAINARWWALVPIIGIVGLLGFGLARRRKFTPRSGDAPGHQSAGAPWLRMLGDRWLQHDASAEILRVSGSRLSPRHHLHVIEWRGKRLLLGCTDNSISVLAEVPAKESVPVPDAEEAAR
ncbi:MAG: flagellar biosynthetic protein FliO [Gammaproteobacteria bacterium]